MDLTTKFFLTAEPQYSERRFVHTSGCQILNKYEGETIELGAFESCEPALLEARRTYPLANGCALCCPTCHETLDSGPGPKADGERH